jgi:uncharacterized membrane protein
MGLSEALAFAFLIGCVCGLRSMTGPAVVCWGAHLGWLPLDNTSFHFLHHPASLVIFTLFAVGELVADKLPSTPSRTQAVPLAIRFLTGALCGGALCAAGGAAWLVGALLGGVGGIAGAFAGYHARHTLVAKSHWPDLVVALLEDAVAIGGGFLLVSRF